MKESFKIQQADGQLNVEILADVSLFDDRGYVLLKQLEHLMSQSDIGLKLYFRSQISLADGPKVYISESGAQRPLGTLMHRVVDVHRLIYQWHQRGTLACFVFEGALRDSWLDFASCFDHRIYISQDGEGFCADPHDQGSLLGAFRFSLLAKGIFEARIYRKGSWQHAWKDLHFVDVEAPSGINIERIRWQLDGAPHNRVAVDSPVFETSKRSTPRGSIGNGEVSSPKDSLPFAEWLRIGTLDSEVLRRRTVLSAQQWQDYLCYNCFNLFGKFQHTSHQATEFTSNEGNVGVGHCDSITRTIYWLLDDAHLFPNVLVAFLLRKQSVVLIAQDYEVISGVLNLISEELSEKVGVISARACIDQHVFWHQSSLSRSQLRETFRPLFELDILGFLKVEEESKSSNYLLIDYGQKQNQGYLVEGFGDRQNALHLESAAKPFPFCSKLWQSQGVGKDAMPFSVWLRCMLLDDVFRMRRLKKCSKSQVIESLQREGWGFMGDETAIEAFARLRLQYINEHPEEYEVEGLHPDKAYWKMDTWLDGAEVTNEQESADATRMSSEYLSWRLGVLTLRCVRAICSQLNLKEHRRGVQGEIYKLAEAIVGWPKRHGSLKAFENELGLRRLAAYSRKIWQHSFSDQVS